MDDRAIELLTMLQDNQLVNLCIKYAAKQNRRLAEKLMEIAPLNNSNSENVGVCCFKKSWFFCSKIVFIGGLFAADYYKTTKQTACFKFNIKIPLEKTTRFHSRSDWNWRRINYNNNNQRYNNSNYSKFKFFLSELHLLYLLFFFFFKDTTLNSSSTSLQINTQDSLFSEELPINPFLKKTKADDANNPLNLTDKYAGYEELQKKEKENKVFLLLFHVMFV